MNVPAHVEIMHIRGLLGIELFCSDRTYYYYQINKGFVGYGVTGCAENELGLRDFLESRGIKYVVTPDKEGPNSEFDKELVDADVVITTPFHPGRL